MFMRRLPGETGLPEKKRKASGYKKSLPLSVACGSYYSYCGSDKY
jgi:hypothetical protein